MTTSIQDSVTAMIPAMAAEIATKIREQTFRQLRALAQRWKSEATAEVARVGVAGAVLEGIRSGCATELLALLDSLPAQPALTADEVSAVVREAFEWLDTDRTTRLPGRSAIADRVAEKLAGQVIALSATERITVTWLRAVVYETVLHTTECSRAVKLLDRLLATEPRS